MTLSAGSDSRMKWRDLTRTPSRIIEVAEHGSRLLKTDKRQSRDLRIYGKSKAAERAWAHGLMGRSGLSMQILRTTLCGAPGRMSGRRLNGLGKSPELADRLLQRFMAYPSLRGLIRDGSSRAAFRLSLAVLHPRPSQSGQKHNARFASNSTALQSAVTIAGPVFDSASSVHDPRRNECGWTWVRTGRSGGKCGIKVGTSSRRHASASSCRRLQNFRPKQSPYESCTHSTLRLPSPAPRVLRRMASLIFNAVRASEARR